MVLKIILILTFLLTDNGQLIAQITNNSLGPRISTTPVMPSVVGSIDGKPLYLLGENEIEGSPYFNDEWLEGKVLLKSGNEIGMLPLKLCLYNYELYYEQNGISYSIDSVREVRFQKKTDSNIYIFRVFPAMSQEKNEGIINIFMQVLVNGKISFLKFEKRSIEQYKDVSQAIHYRFKTIYKYYISVDDGRLQQVKFSSESLLSVLGGYQEEANQLLKEEKIKLKSERSFIEFINKLNTFNK